jgi:hypothetical protein
VIVTEEMYNACQDGAVVNVTYDDVTGAITLVSWVVRAGVLEIAEPPIVAIAGDSGSTTVAPGMLFLDKLSRGGWFYPGISWGDKPHAGAGGWKKEDPDQLRVYAEALLEEKGLTTTVGMS